MVAVCAVYYFFALHVGASGQTKEQNDFLESFEMGKLAEIQPERATECLQVSTEGRVSNLQSGVTS